MSGYLIKGSKKLYGEVTISPAKNSAVTLISACILVKGQVLIKDCPKIYDVLVMAEIINKIGGEAKFNNEGLFIDTKNVYLTTLPKDLCKKVRASLFLVGSLVGRFKHCSIYLPGGCKIGSRPIDIHIDSLKSLNISGKIQDDFVEFYTTKIKGETINLRYPSVGATENIIMASVLSSGVTTILNPAREPEIKDLQDFLNLCGGKISGAGSTKIVIEGVDCLFGDIAYTPISDRIECGTYLLASLVCGGKVTINNCNYINILPLIKKIINNSCQIGIYNDKIYIDSNRIPFGFGTIVAQPYPGFPTDLQPILVGASCNFLGKTIVTETVFENRFGYTQELLKLGADITIDNNSATINGCQLKGGNVLASDLRGGAGLVVASLGIDGITTIDGVEHIKRGYEDFDKKLSMLGVDITEYD